MQRTSDGDIAVPSVCLSMTLRYCFKMANPKLIVKVFLLLDNPRHYCALGTKCQYEIWMVSS